MFTVVQPLRRLGLFWVDAAMDYRVPPAKFPPAERRVNSRLQLSRVVAKRTGPQIRSTWIVGDVSAEVTELCFAANQMIKLFRLPE